MRRVLALRLGRRCREHHDRPAHHAALAMLETARQRLVFPCLEEADTPHQRCIKGLEPGKRTRKPALNGGPRGPAPARVNGKGYGLDPAMRLHEYSDPPARMTKR